MNTISLARMLRFAVVSQQYSKSNINREEAVLLLSGELNPGDPETKVDDSSFLDLDIKEVAAKLEGSTVYEKLSNVIDQIRAMKPNDKSAKDRHFAVVLTDLEKTLAYAVVYLDGK